jgi:hypothetical protein
VVDQEDTREVLSGKARTLRGGSFGSLPADVRSPARQTYGQLANHNSFFGLRVARTTD